jgi:phytol kinase
MFASELMVSLVYCALWLATVFGLAEWLRWRQVEGELVRKWIHIGVGNIILLAWHLQIPRWVGLGFSVVFCGVALLSYRIQILQSLNGVGRKSFGTFFYPLSIGILLLLFWFPETGMQPFAVIGVLVMTWGDALAALVGQTWGQHPYRVGRIRKSWEGSATMWLVSTLIIGLILGSRLGFSGGVWLGAAGIALAATSLEVLSWRGIDNLTVPVVSGVLSYWFFSAVS